MNTSPRLLFYLVSFVPFLCLLLVLLILLLRLVFPYSSPTFTSFFILPSFFFPFSTLSFSFTYMLPLFLTAFLLLTIPHRPHYLPTALPWPTPTPHHSFSPYPVVFPSLFCLLPFVLPLLLFTPTFSISWQAFNVEWKSCMLTKRTAPMPLSRSNNTMQGWSACTYMFVCPFLCLFFVPVFEKGKVNWICLKERKKKKRKLRANKVN